MSRQVGNQTSRQLPTALVTSTYVNSLRVGMQRVESSRQQQGVYRYPCLPTPAYSDCEEMTKGKRGQGR
jgi:hypothetical protein